MPYDNITDYSKALESHLAVRKVCVKPETDSCWHQAGYWTNYSDQYVNMSMESFPTTLNRAFILNNGMLVLHSSFNSLVVDSVHQAYGDDRSVITFVDVNGFKKPNKVGVDIFGLEIFREKILPLGSSGTLYTMNYCDPMQNTSNGPNSGMGCSAKVILGVDY